MNIWSFYFLQRNLLLQLGSARTKIQWGGGERGRCLLTSDHTGIEDFSSLWTKKTKKKTKNKPFCLHKEILLFLSYNLLKSANLPKFFSSFLNHYTNTYIYTTLKLIYQYKYACTHMHMPSHRYTCIIAPKHMHLRIEEILVSNQP